MSARLRRIWRSLCGLPRWVQAWLMILVGTNLASLAFLDTAAGRWTAAAFAVVALLNLPLILLQGGLTRLLSFAHLAWLPLLVFLLSQWASAEPGPRGFMLAVLTIDGISLVFDFLEIWRWARGQREVLGL